MHGNTEGGEHLLCPRRVFSANLACKGIVELLYTIDAGVILTMVNLSVVTGKAILGQSNSIGPRGYDGQEHCLGRVHRRVDGQAQGREQLRTTDYNEACVAQQGEVAE